MADNLNNIDKNLDVADSILDKVGKILKKRWWILLLLVLGYLGYWFFGLVNKEVAKELEAEETATIDTVYVSQPLDTVFYDDGTYELQPRK